jgi:hypothetical protein
MPSFWDYDFILFFCLARWSIFGEHGFSLPLMRLNNNIDIIKKSKLSSKTATGWSSPTVIGELISPTALPNRLPRRLGRVSHSYAQVWGPFSPEDWP